MGHGPDTPELLLSYAIICTLHSIWCLSEFVRALILKKQSVLECSINPYCLINAMPHHLCWRAVSKLYENNITLNMCGHLQEPRKAS